MAECKVCGKKMGFLESNNGMCAECHLDHIRAKSAGNTTAYELQVQKAQKEDATRRVAIEAVLLTTETAPNLNITKRIEIVTAEVAYGMNIFKDLFAAVRDVVGGRSEAVQSTMRDARRTALYELKKEAYEVGANAVVGVDLDYVEISSNSNMIMLVASGTAVVIEEVKK